MGASNPEDIERRLRKLEDIEEIRTLRMRHHCFTNDGEFDRISELFTDDAYVDFGFSQAKGKAEIHDFFLKVPRNLDVVKQFIHNHIVEVDGDEASGIAYLDGRYAQAGDSLMVAAKFEEKYRRTPEGWRISQLRIEVYFSVPVIKGWAGSELNLIKPIS